MSLIVEQLGPVTVVTLDRPERRNAVDRPTAEALREAFAAFEADETAQVAVLTGAGGHFCAGFDLKAFAAVGSADYDPEGEGPMGPTRRLPAKPVIAAVEGYAVAGGLELALWCDLRVASATAVFGVFCRRWGVPLVDGGTVRLPRIVGQGRALDMILTGRPVEPRKRSRSAWPTASCRKARRAPRRSGWPNAIARFPALCMRTDRASGARTMGPAARGGARRRGQSGRRTDPRGRPRRRRALRRRARPRRRFRRDLNEREGRYGSDLEAAQTLCGLYRPGPPQGVLVLLPVRLDHAVRADVPRYGAGAGRHRRGYRTGNSIGFNMTGGLLTLLFGLATLIPSLAVSVRRLHDVGKSGWYLLFIIVLLIGWIYLLYLYVQPGMSGPNEYGPDPKAAETGKVFT